MQIYTNGKKVFEGTLDEYKEMKKVNNIKTFPVIHEWENILDIKKEEINGDDITEWAEFRERIGYTKHIIKMKLNTHYGCVLFAAFMDELRDYGLGKEDVKIALKELDIKYFCASTPGEPIWMYI